MAQIWDFQYTNLEGSGVLAINLNSEGIHAIYSRIQQRATLVFHTEWKIYPPTSFKFCTEELKTACIYFDMNETPEGISEKFEGLIALNLWAKGFANSATGPGGLYFKLFNY